jgi:hypothetical protein
MVVLPEPMGPIMAILETSSNSRFSLLMRSLIGGSGTEYPGVESLSANPGKRVKTVKESY